MTEKMSLLLLLTLSKVMFAQNIMIVNDVSGNAADTVSVRIEIQNADPFVGFQFDMILPDQVSYVNGSAKLSDRAVDDHQIATSIVNDSTLRVLAFSINQSRFSGSSGIVCSFEVKLGTIPGDYSLSLVNAIIGDSVGTNVLTEVRDGKVSILLQTGGLHGEKEPGVPDYFTISQNYPNPFNSSTRIIYSLPNKSDVVLRIFDLTGKEIYIESMYDMTPGDHIVEWNGKDKMGAGVPSGLYVSRISTINYISSIKILFIK